MLAPVKRFALIFIPCLLLAADFWESKPFPEWSDKELQKIMTNSPWARQISAPVNTPGRGGRQDSTLPGADADGIGSRAGRGGGGGGGITNAGALGGGGETSPELASLGGGGTATLPVQIRWLSATPMKQAQMRVKYGKEAATAPEAQKFLEQPSKLYIVAVAGIPGFFVSAMGGDKAKDGIAKSTTLTFKGKEPLRPTAIQFVPNGGNVDVILGFDRTIEITLADQEAELTGVIGTANVRSKFKLKDMVVKGKLEL